MRAKNLKPVLVALVSLALAGCVELDPQQLVVADLEPGRKHPHSLSVVVDGPSYGDLAKNTNETIELALERSIEVSRVFWTVIHELEGDDETENSAADYRLRLTVQKIVQRGGFTGRTRAIILWELFRSGGSEAVWRDAIDTDCSVESGPRRTRQQSATECAVRKNLDQGLHRLAELKLAP